MKAVRSIFLAFVCVPMLASLSSPRTFESNHHVTKADRGCGNVAAQH